MTERVNVKPERRKVALAVLSAIGIVVFCNLQMVTVAALMDFWEIYEHGWPIEILLVSLGLCVIMYLTSTIWMLIPTGIIFGTGILFAYSELTGNWDHWTFLWVFELWIVVGSVVIPISLSKRKDVARKLSLPITMLVGISSAALILIIAFAATLKALFS